MTNHVASPAMRYISLFFLLLAILAHSVHGQQSAPTPKIHVQLTISADDGLDDRLRSYFGKELRKFNDVEIDDTTPMFQLDVVALTTHNTDGTQTGYTLSVVLTSLTDRRLVLASTKQLPDGPRKVLEQTLSKEGTVGRSPPLYSGAGTAAGTLREDRCRI